MKEANIFLNQAKIKEHQRQVIFLGLQIGFNSIQIPESRRQAIKNLTAPTNKKELQSTLGFLNFFRMFIPYYSTLATGMLNSINKFDKDQVLKSFRATQAALLKSLVLTPIDVGLPVHVISDASMYATGAVVYQKGEDHRTKIIGCYSHKLTETQGRYSATERELVGIIVALLSVEGMLLTPQIIVHTDHQPLIYAYQQINSNLRLTRLFAKISEYPYRLHYIKGEFNIADVLSRLTKGDSNFQHMIDNLLHVDNQEDTQADEQTTEDMDSRDSDEVNSPTLSTDVTTTSTTRKSPRSIYDLTDEDIQYILSSSSSFDEEWNAFIRENIVCKDKESIWVRIDEKLLTYIPKTGAIPILKAIHEKYHSSPRVVENNFLEKGYFNPELRLLSTSICAECPNCDVFKTWKGINNELAPFRQETAVGTIIHVDHIELRVGSGEAKYVFVLSELITGYIILFPTLRISLTHTANSLLQAAMIFPTLTTVISDNHSIFRSQQLAHILEPYGINFKHGPSYYPQANGFVERRNHDVKTLLRDLSFKPFASQITEERFVPWSKYVLLASMIYNLTKNIYGFSPYYLLTGNKKVTVDSLQKIKIDLRSPSLAKPKFGVVLKDTESQDPIASVVERALNKDNGIYTLDSSTFIEKEIIDTRLFQIENNDSTRAENIKAKSHTRNLKKILYDRYANKTYYTPGELVLIKNIKQHKMEPFAAGPYIVSARIGNFTYKLRKVDARKDEPSTFNISRLIPAFSFMGSPIRALSDYRYDIYKGEKRLTNKLKAGDTEQNFSKGE